MEQSTKKPNISFFFPAFNDEKTIENIVLSAKHVLNEITEEYEIIIVNDGSIDNTAHVANNISKTHPEVRVVHHLYNIGYGGALKTGFASCKYDFIFYTDGDHQFNISELKNFIQHTENYDFISGYRINRAYSYTRKLSSKLYNLFIKLFFGIKWKDVDCAFKLLKKDIVKNSASFVNSAFICSEMFFEAEKNNRKILQLPVTHYPRKHGESHSFSLFFILRSVIELFEALWKLKYKDKFYRHRQNILKKVHFKKK